MSTPLNHQELAKQVQEFRGGISSVFQRDVDARNEPLTQEAFMYSLNALYQSSYGHQANTIVVSVPTWELMKLWFRFWTIIKTLFGTKTPSNHQLRKITWPPELREFARRATWA